MRILVWTIIYIWIIGILWMIYEPLGYIAFGIILLGLITGFKQVKHVVF